MPSVPVPADPGWDDDLAWLDRDPEREHWLDRAREYDEPGPEEEEEYGDHDELTAEELAEIRAAAADEVLAVEAASTGRRGPGHPGSARVFPGESASTAAGFGAGMALDITPGGADLAVAADAAAGDGDQDCFNGVADHELIGLLCAWDRLEAHMAARKLAVAAELLRRNPEDGFEPSPGAMPEVVSEFAADQVACALAESRNHADGMLTMAWHLATRLTGTMAALRDGMITRHKAEIIVRATVTLEPEEAKSAEAKVLDRAGRLTPGSLRAAIARAVMEVAPKKARKRREEARKDARVERWQEDSGNAALAGFELPPDEALAADQRITWWARELKKAGLEGDMDVLRARAFLDLVLGKDSRPTASAAGAADPGAAGGFAGRATLTVPLATLLDLADRPGDIPGIGPIDPWLARDLADAAARNPKSTWCVTVTDQHGHAIGHGCARPGPLGGRSRRTREGPDPPWFTFTRTSRDGPPTGYGTWRLRTPGPGPDRHPRLHQHRPMRASLRGQGARPRGQAAAPVPDPARDMHRAGVPAAGRHQRL
jgi:Domain of unknown function (DUF222)